MQKLSDFINFALFNPISGYYRIKNPIGKNADFITAPEVSQVFGELTAAYLLQISSTKKSPIALLEMGAGKGTWFKDILSTIQKLADKKNPQAIDFLERATFHIIEIGEVLREIQHENLREFAGRIFWYESFEDFLNRPRNEDGVTKKEGFHPVKKEGCHHVFITGSVQDNYEEIFFISNELFDCFAIDQFVKTEEGWRERMAEKVDGKNHFMLAEFNQKTHSFVEKNLEKNISDAAPINAIFEYSESARKFMAELCKALKKQGGMALIFDYGYKKTEFANTLQAIKNHQKTSVLENVGECDITALVDFSALKKIAENFALNSSLVSQREFLILLGIEERRKVLLQKKSPDEQKKINSAIDRLIDSAQMGELFKCLILWKE